MTTNNIDNIYNTLLPVFEKYRHKIIFAYLFGSAIQYNTHPLSDIDIAVFLADSTRDFFFDDKLSLYADFCRALKRNDIDVVVLNTTNNIMLLDEIIRYGVVIYDTDTDFREDFELKVLHQAVDFKKQRLAIIGI